MAKDLAKLAGMSDDAVAAKTGRDWRAWKQVLDKHKAQKLTHREIAHLLGTQYELPGWWAQMVAVGYERMSGLRDKGQQRSGGYDANKSRTFAVPVGKLYDAISNKRQRMRWLDADVTVTNARRAKSLSMRWNQDNTRVRIWFTSKARNKSQVALQHIGLPSKSAMEKAKKAWHTRLDKLQSVVES